MRTRLERLAGNALVILAALVLGFALGGGPAGSQTTGSTRPQAVTSFGAFSNAAPTVSGANAAATITLTGSANQRWCIRGVYIKATGANATFTLTMQDGGSIILDLGTQTATNGGAAFVQTGNPLMCASLGAQAVVNIGAGGASAVTNTTLTADLL